MLNAVWYSGNKIRWYKNYSHAFKGLIVDKCKIYIKKNPLNYYKKNCKRRKLQN